MSANKKEKKSWVEKLKIRRGNGLMPTRVKTPKTQYRRKGKYPDSEFTNGE